MSRVLIKGASVITMDDRLGDFPRADLLVEHDRIVAIRPDLATVPVTDLAARGQAITAGEEAARAALPQIRRMIAERTAGRPGANTGRSSVHR